MAESVNDTIRELLESRMQTMEALLAASDAEQNFKTMHEDQESRAAVTA